PLQLWEVLSQQAGQFLRGVLRGIDVSRVRDSLVSPELLVELLDFKHVPDRQIPCMLEVLRELQLVKETVLGRDLDNRRVGCVLTGCHSVALGPVPLHLSSLRRLQVTEPNPADEVRSEGGMGCLPRDAGQLRGRTSRSN